MKIIIKNINYYATFLNLNLNREYEIKDTEDSRIYLDFLNKLKDLNNDYMVIFKDTNIVINITDVMTFISCYLYQLFNLTGFPSDFNIAEIKGGNNDNDNDNDNNNDNIYDMITLKALNSVLLFDTKELDYFITKVNDFYLK